MNIRTGAIICAQVKHPTGRGRDIGRFYLVISANEDNLKSVFCLGISKQCPDPAPANAVLLPFDPNPSVKPMTGLRRRCACFVDWGLEIFPEEILDSRVGYVSSAIFKAIKEAFDSYRNKGK